MTIIILASNAITAVACCRIQFFVLFTKL